MRLAALLLLTASARAAVPALVLPQEDKLLMLDTRVIAETHNAQLVLGRPEKAAENPLLPSDQPWENATNNYYPNVTWDGQEQQWKLWYKDVLADKDVIAKMDGPSTVHDVGWYLLYAHSKDGLTWKRPDLGLHKFAGSNANNIVARDCPNVGVFKDLYDPDPARRYKMVYDTGLGKPHACFSADGIRWSPPQDMLGFSAKQGDTHNNAFYDTRSGKYLWFTKMYLGERLVSRLESTDFLNWKSSGVVLRSSLDEGKATQTYALTVFPYANIYLGYVMMYHLGHGRTVDVELAWSPDSITWKRVQPGTAFLPLGAKENYDSGCIYAQAGPPVQQDGKLMIYYGGSPTIHLGWKRSASLCLARLREDGFAAYEAEDATEPAVLTTTLLRASDKPITLSADGEVSHEKFPAEDGTFRLKLRLAPGAKLYAISGVTLVDTKLPAPKLEPLPKLPVQRGALAFTFDQDAQGWQGVDQARHQPEGFITVSRAKNLRPIAHAQPLPGDWPVLIGGDEVTISARIRATQPGGAIRLEIFARDVYQWSYEKLPAFTTDWQTVSATLRYDWTDEQARVAGWVPSTGACSWREMIRHAGKVVFVAAQAGTQQSFDLDDVRIEAK